MIFSICFLITCALHAVSLAEDDSNGNKIIFVIVSQPNKYHEAVAERKRYSVINELFSSNVEHPMVYIAPSDFQDMPGYWTFFPIVENFSNNNFSWLFLMDENTNVSVQGLLEVLHKYNAEEDNFIGYSMRDERPTIVHHFDDLSIPLYFPHLSAGMALTAPLVRKIAQKWRETTSVTFSIDPKYEFSKFLYQECGGVKLVHEPSFCITTRGPKCVTWIDMVFPTCNKSVSNEEVYFAVKTCQKYHKDRVQIVENTWGSDVHKLVFYSDIDNPTVPTKTLDVENVSHGHCRKTISIIEDFKANSASSEKWLVIADDDTLFSVPRLLQLLSCYDPSEPVALGERYGYRTAFDNGYDYITGGGGMIFSVPMVNLIVSDCECPSADSPDDMILGMCLKKLGIGITHLPYFHQARPEDYNNDFLQSYLPVSFHKHWNIDPLYVYKTYLEVSYSDKHDEL